MHRHFSVLYSTGYHCFSLWEKLSSKAWEYIIRIELYQLCPALEIQETVFIMTPLALQLITKGKSNYYRCKYCGPRSVYKYQKRYFVLDPGHMKPYHQWANRWSAHQKLKEQIKISEQKTEIKSLKIYKISIAITAGDKNKRRRS